MKNPNLILCRSSIILLALIWVAVAFCGEIHDAAKNGDAARVKALLKVEPGLVSSKDENGMTPLHWAARSRHKDVAKLLLASGADANAKDNNGRSPLKYVSGDGGDADMTMLLSNAAFPMHAAAKGGYVGKMNALLKSNPDLVFSKDDYDRTPLHCAAYYGEIDAAKLLLAHKADINAKGEGGRTALHEAAEWHHKDMVKLLLSKKADVSIKDNDGKIALHLACGDKEIVTLLLVNGTDVNAKGEFDETPLHIAADCGSKTVAALLLANGADVNAKDQFGFTPLHLAAANGHKDVVELLLAKKADINAKDEDGCTPLTRAIFDYGGHKNVAELLLAKGASYDFRDAVYIGDLEKVKTLLQSDPNLVFSRAKSVTSGPTPLVWAVSINRKDIAELLISYKADVNVRDGDGITPLHRAELWGKKDMVELLRQHGGHE